MDKYPKTWYNYAMSKGGIYMNKSMKATLKILEGIESGFYQVSENGELLRNGRVLGGKPQKTGYITYKLNCGRAYAHRVMYAYYHGIENLHPDLSINHINGNKLDNHKENLEQLSLADNTRHQWRENLAVKGENCSYSKLTEDQVLEIKKLLKEGELFQYQIAEMFGVKRTTILNINLGHNWKHVTLEEETD